LSDILQLSSFHSEKFPLQHALPLLLGGEN